MSFVGRALLALDSYHPVTPQEGVTYQPARKCHSTRNPSPFPERGSALRSYLPTSQLHNPHPPLPRSELPASARRHLLAVALGFAVVAAAKRAR